MPAAKNQVLRERAQCPGMKSKWVIRRDDSTVAQSTMDGWLNDYVNFGFSIMEYDPIEVNASDGVYYGHAEMTEASGMVTWTVTDNS